MNRIISRHQPKNNNEVQSDEVNPMNNSIALLMIYHGLPKTNKKPASIKEA